MAIVITFSFLVAITILILAKTYRRKMSRAQAISM